MTTVGIEDTLPLCNPHLSPDSSTYPFLQHHNITVQSSVMKLGGLFPRGLNIAPSDADPYASRCSKSTLPVGQFNDVTGRLFTIRRIHSRPMTEPTHKPCGIQQFDGSPPKEVHPCRCGRRLTFYLSVWL